MYNLAKINPHNYMLNSQTFLHGRCMILYTLVFGILSGTQQFSIWVYLRAIAELLGESITDNKTMQ